MISSDPRPRGSNGTFGLSANCERNSKPSACRAIFVIPIFQSPTEKPDAHRLPTGCARARAQTNKQKKKTKNTTNTQTNTHTNKQTNNTKQNKNKKNKQPTNQPTQQTNTHTQGQKVKGAQPWKPGKRRAKIQRTWVFDLQGPCNLVAYAYQLIRPGFLDSLGCRSLNSDTSKISDLSKSERLYSHWNR